MDIDLENSIVILDEAHNIEDAARDAGGLDVPDEDLRIAEAEFADMIKHNIMAQPSKTLLNVSLVACTYYTHKCFTRTIELRYLTLACLAAFSILACDNVPFNLEKTGDIQHSGI